MKVKPICHKTSAPALWSCAAGILISATSAFADLTWSYVSSSDVPVSSDSYSASGQIELSLAFTPPTGATLTVVENTGIDFISGNFANLSHGQEIALNYGGIVYNYVANYFGGTGNDLVLQWRDVRPLSCGWNQDGQLGRTGNQAVLLPVESGVLGSKTVVTIAAGGKHSLALCSDGTLAAWGSNDHGQLGNDDEDDSSIPVAVDQTGVLAGKTIVAIAAGWQHSLALCSDGTLAAWGSGTNGELGNGGTANSAVPVNVDMSGALAGKKVVRISSGRWFNCVLCSDGSLATWGDGGNGELGNNTTGFSTTPVNVIQSGVLSNKDVADISCGWYHVIVMCADGVTASWGENFDGQLGDGTWTDRKTPVLVSQSGLLAGQTVVQIVAGGFHSLALCSDSTLAAWGKNSNGQLGVGDQIDKNVPTGVNQAGALSGREIQSLGAGNAYSMAACSDGSLIGWGSSQSGQVGNGSTGVDVLLPALAQTTGLESNEIFISGIAHSSSSHTLALAASVPVASAYVIWAATNAGGQGPSEDFDLDGVPNGVEFFLNAPLGFTMNPVPIEGDVIWPNGQNIAPSEYGIQFAVEVSDDLSEWATVPSGSSSLVVTNEILTYSLPSGDGPHFVRLRVTPN